MVILNRCTYHIIATQVAIVPRRLKSLPLSSSWLKPGASGSFFGEGDGLSETR
jgi:hypothetical protein